MKRIKIEKDTLSIVIAVVLIVVYIAVQSFSASNVKMQIQTANETVAYDSVSAKALAVRQEAVLPADSSQMLLPTVDDGDKVAVNGEVAKVFSSPDVAARYVEINDLNEELNRLTALENSSSGLVTDLESANRSIVESLNRYVCDRANEKTQDVSKELANINNSIVKQQLIIGESIDFSQMKSSISQQISTLSSMGYKPQGNLTTDKSGIFSTFTDGFENIADYNNIDSFTVENLESCFEQIEKSEDKDNHFGKMIYNYDWYFICTVNSSDLGNLKDGDSVDVCLKNDADTVYKMKIVKGADVSPETEKTLLVLQSNDMNSKITSLRVEDIEIRLKKYEGIKVPKKAIRVVDEKTGIYALVSYKIEFREIEILYSDDDYAVVKYEPEKEDGIRLYDQIIVEGKDLYDGKVYT